jgi:hypothetical protein
MRNRGVEEESIRVKTHRNVVHFCSCTVECVCLLMEKKKQQKTQQWSEKEIEEASNVVHICCHAASVGLSVDSRNLRLKEGFFFSINTLFSLSF